MILDSCLNISVDLRPHSAAMALHRMAELDGTTKQSWFQPPVYTMPHMQFFPPLVSSMGFLEKEHFQGGFYWRRFSHNSQEQQGMSQGAGTAEEEHGEDAGAQGRVVWFVCIELVCFLWEHNIRKARVYVVLFSVPAITFLSNQENFCAPKAIVYGRKTLLTVSETKKWREASWEPAVWSRRLLRGAGELLPTAEPSQVWQVLGRQRLYLRDRGNGSGCSNPGSH